jgi:hypothetical protein
LVEELVGNLLQQVSKYVVCGEQREYLIVIVSVNFVTAKEFTWINEN